MNSNKNVVHLRGELCTNYSGYTQIVSIYHKLKDEKDKTIAIDFYELKWFDANLCSLLKAVLHKLNKDNGLIFSVDGVFLENNFDILFRNGFLESNYIKGDSRKSAVCFMEFEVNHFESFEHYIYTDLINHRGMPKMDNNLKQRIQYDLMEIFNNVNLHANTSEPIFVCGQYYPTNKNLIFTMVDLGEGFLPKINEYTKNEIKTSKSAIEWAINGNSIKPFTLDEPGGLGLIGIWKYCMENNGILEVVTGDAYWSTDLAQTIWEGSREITKPFVGSTINLFFKCN